MADLVFLQDFRRSRRKCYFTRPELQLLLQLYGTYVAKGEWRDYAIDHIVGMAVFSIFRHSHERPLYAIVKFDGGGERPDEFALFQGATRLKRGGQLADMIAALHKKMGSPREI